MNEINEIFDTFKKSPLRFLKRNFNLIIILPALLGGIWQIIELSRMSFSFIRFFSVGQIIPDGLLILLFLIIFSSSTFILLYFWKQFDSEVEEENVFNPKPNKLYVIIFGLFFYGTIAFFLWLNNYFLGNIESLLNLFLFVPANIIITLLSVFFCRLSIVYCDKECEFFQEYRKFMTYLLLVPYCFLVIVLLSFGNKFHEIFVLPEKLKNVDNLICKVEKIDVDAKFEILYSNDKYIFVECHKFTKDRNGKPTSTQIRILRFEDLFNDTACIGSKRIRKEFVKDSIWDSKQPKVLPN